MPSPLLSTLNVFSYSLFTPTSGGKCRYYPHLQMRTLRHREVTHLLRLHHSSHVADTNPQLCLYVLLLYSGRRPLSPTLCKVIRGASKLSASSLPEQHYILAADAQLRLYHVSVLCVSISGVIFPIPLDVSMMSWESWDFTCVQRPSERPLRKVFREQRRSLWAPGWQLLRGQLPVLRQQEMFTSLLFSSIVFNVVPQTISVRRAEKIRPYFHACHLAFP